MSESSTMKFSAALAIEPVLAPALENDRSSARAPRALFLAMGVSSTLLFALAAVRHNLFRSGGMDLGFFDQLVYLISQGRTPMSSFRGFHVLGDHAAYLLYPLALLYRIWPDVHVLLAVQAIGLSLGAYPVFRLAQHAGLDSRKSLLMSLAYLGYPSLIAVNLFDFHPEVLSVPALLFAILAAKRDHIGWFIFALLIAMGGKEVVSLTVAAIGFWLVFVEKKQLVGVIALVMGLGWFVVATQIVIPHFGGGRGASGLHFFSYLGDSIPKIIAALIIHPDRWLKQILTVRSAIYISVLFVPMWWGISARTIAPMLISLPALGLNLLSKYEPTTDPTKQYAIIVLPGLILWVIATTAANRTWLRTPRLIGAWIAVLFFVATGALAYGKLSSRHATDLDSHSAVREAIAKIDGGGAVLTTHEISPHLSQRALIQFVSEQNDAFPQEPVAAFDYVLLNLTNQSLKSEGDLAMQVFNSVRANPNFELTYENTEEWVYLFRRKRPQNSAVAQFPTLHSPVGGEATTP